MSTSLSDKYPGVALVTGASAGLGAAFARQIAGSGLDIVLVSRRRKVLEAVAHDLKSRHNVRVWVVEQDLAAPDAAEQVKGAVKTLNVPVSVLVNCAGIGRFGRFHEGSGADELRIVQVNCGAFVGITAAFLPEMVARGNGAVMFVSSTCAPRPVPGFATYGATKAFALSFGQAVASDLVGTGVDVLTFVPGYIRTEFHQNAGMPEPPTGVVWNDPDEAALAALAALGRRKLLLYRPTKHTPLAELMALTRRAAGKYARKWLSTSPSLPLAVIEILTSVAA